jgi:hypothetical protein
LEGRLGIAVRPRAEDYELAFPSQWLDRWTPIAGLPPAATAAPTAAAPTAAAPTAAGP